MAIVRRLVEHRQLDPETEHSEADGTYSIVGGRDRIHLQIDSHGSRERKLLGKKSQSIRFSPEAIEQLKAIPAKHFV